MIKLLLVDDEPHALEIMRNYLEPLGHEVDLKSACMDIKSAVKEIQLQRPDVLLLDIELGDGLSFEILEHFPHLDARIIFVTAHDDYLLKAIKYHAFDYLFKPVIAAELTAAVEKAIGDIREKKPQQNGPALLEFIKKNASRRIAVPSRNGLTYYALDDIVYIEADGSYAVMHFKDQKPATVSRKVKDFESSLASKGFLRVHKSYLVNINHIFELHREDSGYLVMSNQSRVPISPKDKEQIIELIRQSGIII
jgi:two-component system LytT family response regulator